jgi:hypothetical protein
VEQQGTSGAARPRQEATQRFGSRAWARKLMEARGEVCPSGRHPRLERREGAVVTASVGATAEAGRRRLLPFELRLATATGSTLLFGAGPFDELRCFQRRVTGRHSVEYLTCLEPRDFGSEGYEPFGRIDLSESMPLAPLRRQQRLWLELRSRGIRTLPSARIRGQRRDVEGNHRQGVINLEPRLDAGSGSYKRGSGSFKRGSQPLLSGEEVSEILLNATGLERVAWLEEGFRSATAPGEALHRYYLDRNLTLYLVRQTGMDKTITVLEPTSTRARRGLLIYAKRVLLAA